MILAPLGGLLVAAALTAWHGGPQRIAFADVTAPAGVAAVHRTRTFSGPYSETLRLFTSGGASAAVADFDNDGFDDVFVTDSDIGRPNHLYRNNGNFTFTDVAEQAGVAGGNDPGSIVSDALWFDYDNDGYPDLLVARFGTPLLYHNERNGRFKDVSKSSGLSEFANTIAAIGFDADGDGMVDLLFGNYFAPVNLTQLKSNQVLPDNLDNAANGGGLTLWRNVGGGRFENITRKAGLGSHSGWTLDIGAGDFTNDGLPDIYVASDYGTDRIFFNRGDGVFEDVTAKAMGFDTKKGMNAEVGDFDNDGWLDVYVTNITDEYMREFNMLWRNNGDSTFVDVSREVGVGNTLWGWGAKFADFDNDGWLDLFVANGLRSAGSGNYISILLPMIVRPNVDFSDLASWPAIGNRSWSGYQRKKLFHNDEGQMFREVGKQAAVDNDRDGRGVAIADFDNDGRLDIFQTNADQTPMLYRGVAAEAGHWVQLKLKARGGNVEAVGARVSLQAGGLKQIREVDAGNGYAAQSMRRLHFGLGKARELDELKVRWPDGLTESFEAPLDRLTVLEKGQGKRSMRETGAVGSGRSVQ